MWWLNTLCEGFSLEFCLKYREKLYPPSSFFGSQFGLTEHGILIWMWTVGFLCHIIFGWKSLNTFWSIFLSQKFVSCRSFNRLQGSPLVIKLASAVGIIIFAVWGLGPLVRLSRNILLHVLHSSSYFSSWTLFFLLFISLYEGPFWHLVEYLLCKSSTNQTQYIITSCRRVIILGRRVVHIKSQHLIFNQCYYGSEQSLYAG